MFCNQTGRHPIGRYFFCSDNKKSAARSNGFFRFYTLVADLRQMQTLDIFAQIQKPPKMRDFWKRTSQMIQCTPTKQKECVLHPTPLKFSAPIPSHLSKQT